MTLNRHAIRERRDEPGLTQEQLKERTHVQVRTIQRAEAGNLGDAALRPVLGADAGDLVRDRPRPLGHREQPALAAGRVVPRRRRTKSEG